MIYSLIWMNEFKKQWFLLDKSQAGHTYASTCVENMYFTWSRFDSIQSDRIESNWNYVYRYIAVNWSNLLLYIFQPHITFVMLLFFFFFCFLFGFVEIGVFFSLQKTHSNRMLLLLSHNVFVCVSKCRKIPKMVRSKTFWAHDHIEDEDETSQ